MQATFRSSYPHTVISYQQCYTWSCEARKSGYITVFSALGKGGVQAREWLHKVYML